MNITLDPGIYVVAVSGGVDSMVLLDILAAGDTTTHKLVIAHFEHGVREDSDEDRQLVQETALRHGLPFVYDRGNLGPGVSEAVARKARYEFLHRVRVAAKATAIITGHHQDDMLETAIINVMRGTGRKGLSSLQSKDTVLRPLLHVRKQAIKDYAKKHKVAWREDSTNADETYLRNYVRRNVLNKFSTRQRAQLVALLDQSRVLNAKIEPLVAQQLHVQPSPRILDRQWFIALPHKVAAEFMASWLRGQGVTEFDAKAIERLVTAGKTYRTNKQADVDSKHVIVVTSEHLALQARDR